MDLPPASQRLRRELTQSALEGALAGGVVFAAWFVGLSLFMDEILGSRPGLDWLMMPAFDHGLLLGGGAAAIIAAAFIGVRMQAFVQMRVNPERMALFDKLTADLPVMLYQFRQWPTGFGSVTYATNAIRSIYGLTPEDVRKNGNQILSLVHRDDYDRVFESLLRSHQRLTPWQEEYRVVLPKAGVQWRMGRARVERLPDGGTLWHGFVIDITAEKQTEIELAEAKESAETANRAKSRFLAMMSHDIRTPMNGMIGFAGLLKDSPLSAEQREHVDAIERCGENLLGLVNDILDLSKIEAGHMSIEPRVFDLRACVEEIAGIVGVRARARAIDLQVEIGPELPPGIATDRTRLVQVLTNLLGNAVKFTEFGGVTLRVECSATAPDPAAVWTFAVTDTGPGIPEKEQPSVFTAFHQLGGPRREEGSGLGLAITRQICRRLGGDVKLRSEPGRGSTFTATLVAPALAAPAATPEPAGDFAGKFPDLRVLLVEDNLINAKLALLMLKRLDCSPDHAVSASEALFACRREWFDVVLMDIQMPGMNGLEAAREIRALERAGELPGRRPLLVVALTANAMPEDRAAALEAGMDDYLTKPIREAEFRRVLAGARPG